MSCGQRSLYSVVRRVLLRKDRFMEVRDSVTFGTPGACSAAIAAAGVTVVHPDVKARQAQLSQLLDNAFADDDTNTSSNSEARSRLIEVRQWKEAEAAWAREVEAGKRRERGLGAAREEAEVVRVRAERKLEEAHAELESRDFERQVYFKV